MSTQRTYRGITLRGLPVQIEFEWPFHPSAGGSDWYVVHGVIRLADGGPLHAGIAASLAQTIKEVLPSLASDLAFWVVVNTTRKALDQHQIELLKSGKRQPVPVSSRSYNIRQKHFSFWSAAGREIAECIARKVFWGSGSERAPILIADPCDAQYLGAADPNMVDRLLAAARDLAARGLIELSGDYARATDKLLAQQDTFRAIKDQELAQLQAKHAFERG